MSVKIRDSIFTGYLFHEGINKIPSNNILCLSPETEDIVGPETFKYVGRGFRLVCV